MGTDLLQKKMRDIDFDGVWIRIFLSNFTYSTKASSQTRKQAMLCSILKILPNDFKKVEVVIYI